MLQLSQQISELSGQFNARLSEIERRLVSLENKHATLVSATVPQSTGLDPEIAPAPVSPVEHGTVPSVVGAGIFGHQGNKRGLSKVNTGEGDGKTKSKIKSCTILAALTSSPIVGSSNSIIDGS